jgi:GNAT superfamily N-acetyltransferase
MPFDPNLLSLIEDASLNASAPPQQRWLDGWLLRFNPGKAKRARCVNAVATGRLPVADKLQRARALFAEMGLPLVVRITPFTQPAHLDAELAALGLGTLDDTRVLVNLQLPPAPADHPPAPAGLVWQALPPADYAEAVGQLRGSPAAQRAAHAERLLASPVPYQGFAWVRASDGQVQCCGQFAREAEFVGLYDVFTRPEARGQGLAAGLCQRLLGIAVAQGARVGYLQVEHDNPARRIYERLGFAEGYRYHYREWPVADSGQGA